MDINSVPRSFGDFWDEMKKDLSEIIDRIHENPCGNQ
jgi:hypothetical protein